MLLEMLLETVDRFVKWCSSSSRIMLFSPFQSAVFRGTLFFHALRPGLAVTRQVPVDVTC
jgi:hypothetical protein